MTRLFNLLAGCKPVQEQWLDYLKERGVIRDLKVTILHPGDADYAQKTGLKGIEFEAHCRYSTGLAALIARRSQFALYEQR